MKKNRSIYIILIVASVAMAGVLMLLFNHTPKRSSESTMHKPQGFKKEVVLRSTPVKDQGQTEACWIYAMLATIETDCLAHGDSVHLSPLWLIRKNIERQGEKYNMRGTLPEALDLFKHYGIVAYDAYRLADKEEFDAKKLPPAPINVYMYGARYTPQEFARSCALADEWQAVTSFTHLPYGESFALEIPDNRRGYKALNVPLDSLLRMVEESLHNGHPVAWEGCMNLDRFYDDDDNDDDNNPPTSSGTAESNTSASSETTKDTKPLSLTKERQRLWDDGILTDDHCMAIIGMGHDAKGRRIFVLKNSWGTNDGYHGYRFLTARQLLLSTIILMVHSS